MKKKIIIGIGIFSLIFFLGGSYLIIMIEQATSTLDNLIKLHQVEIMREQLLFNTKRVQADLAFKNTRYAREIDTVIANVMQMESEADKCLGCHHSGEITKKLLLFKGQINSYEGALSRVLTMRANTARLEAAEDQAFMVGHELIYQMQVMTNMTQNKLKERTRATLKRIGDIKVITFILIAMGPVVAVFLALLFIKGFTGPFNLLLLSTRRIKDGDLSVRIHGLKDEFGEMAASFNEMAYSLNEQMHKMWRAQQMTMLGEMAAGLVHEIKNPLAGIKGSLQIMQEKECSEEEGKEILSKTLYEVQRIESLMRSLLNFAKPSQPQPVMADINVILESTISFSLSYPSLAPNAANSVTIVKDYASSLPTTMIDPIQLQQAFLNILINALQAMPDGGTLTVRTSARVSDREGVIIEISDTGKGIDERIKDKIFRPFFTTRSTGTGLGLAIGKQFIEMQGGSISAEKNPGGGTTFSIFLPSGQMEAPPGETACA